MAGRKRKASTATPANAKKVEPDTTPEQTSANGRRRSLRVSSSTKKSKYFDPESNSESEQAPEKDEAKPKSKGRTPKKDADDDDDDDDDVYEDEPNNNPDGDDEEDSFDESAPPKVTFIPLPKLRGTGGVEYSDDTLHPNTLAFLADLKANNVRSWLKSNDNEFRRSLKDWESWVTTFTDKMMECDPTIPELPFKDVNFRIYRDIRFSNDPTPYKPHYSAAWSRTGRKGPYACYYVHVEPGGNSLVGGGLWHPDGPALQRIRADIDQRPDRLRDILFGDSELRKTFFPGSIRGSKGGGSKGCFNAGSEKKVLWDSFCGGMNAENALKKAPKGYPANHPNIELLKLRNFTLSKRVDDSVFTDTNGQERVKEIVRAMVPFITYLNRIVMPDPGDDDDDDDEDGDGGGGGGGGEDDEEDDEDMDDDGKEEGEEDENDNIEIAGDEEKEEDGDEADGDGNGHDYSVYSAADLMKQLGLSCWVEAIEPRPKTPKVTAGKKRRRKSYY
ncbi:hypothetical protein QBC46DRAFT_302875 [Diplogelasinospora grovesii]|uniref:DUF2461 domain-containing protein n=1 Tax=Diplogelasinospora grovesii TaxID=303347 RepID=A0AAN6SAC2_9PEZI|nr:hypothetical protein QBC46DRAFT_302875 [Diplogelasinospora grovesii]